LGWPSDWSSPAARFICQFHILASKQIAKMLQNKWQVHVQSHQKVELESNKYQDDKQLWICKTRKMLSPVSIR
jgi:hypothetical protein